MTLGRADDARPSAQEDVQRSKEGFRTPSNDRAQAAQPAREVAQGDAYRNTREKECQRLPARRLEVLRKTWHGVLE